MRWKKGTKSQREPEWRRNATSLPSEGSKKLSASEEGRADTAERTESVKKLGIGEKRVHGKEGPWINRRLLEKSAIFIEKMDWTFQSKKASKSGEEAICTRGANFVCALDLKEGAKRNYLMSAGLITESETKYEGPHKSGAWRK